jgi:hypothetical protein
MRIEIVKTLLKINERGGLILLLAFEVGNTKKREEADQG